MNKLNLTIRNTDVRNAKRIVAGEHSKPVSSLSGLQAFDKACGVGFVNQSVRSACFAELIDLFAYLVDNNLINWVEPSSTGSSSVKELTGKLNSVVANTVAMLTGMFPDTTICERLNLTVQELAEIRSVNNIPEPEHQPVTVSDNLLKKTKTK